MKRLPNGYGTIKKLGGNRRRPFGAYLPSPPLTDPNQKRECLGYFETYAEAAQALSEWNKTRSPNINSTFEQFYKIWEKSHYKKISEQAVRAYQAAYKHLAPLHSMKIREIKTGHFQAIFDQFAEELGQSSLNNMKIVAVQTENIAMQYDVINKNYAEFVVINAAEKPQEKEAFTEDQVRTIEDAAARGFMSARIIMILIYTGWRVQEFLDLTVDDYDPDGLTLIGGKKTKNGKNRIVPVNKKIKPYIDELAAQNGPRLFCIEKKGQLKPYNQYYFREFCFKPTLKALNIFNSDGKDFTPHACRHTFASIAFKSGMNPLVLKKIIGHSPKADITEKTYIHIDDKQLKDGMNLLDKSS